LLLFDFLFLTAGKKCRWISENFPKSNSIAIWTLAGTGSAHVIQSAKSVGVT
jgi:hypothetical protein